MKKMRYIALMLIGIISSTLVSCSKDVTTEDISNKMVGAEGMMVEDIYLTEGEITNANTIIDRFIEVLKQKDRFKPILNDNKGIVYEFKDLLDKDYSSKLSGLNKDSVLYNIVNGFYCDENMEITSGTLVSVRYFGDERHYIFDINGEDGDTGFHTLRVDLNILKNNYIKEIKLQGVINDVENTETPLTKDSYLDDNSLFMEEFNKFRKGMTNTSLYNKINAGEENDRKIGYLAGNLPVVSKSKSDVKEIFMTTKGVLKDFSVVEIEYNDIDKKSQTIYTIAVPNIGSPLYFKLTFGRISNRLLNLELLK